jgi:hypothetical protein
MAAPTRAAGGQGGAGAGGVNQAVQVLTAQVDEMKISVEGLEKERYDTPQIPFTHGDGDP